MEERQALMSFAALSQETRLGVVRTLVVAGPDGMAAGAIAEKMGVSPSNISFHLKELERAGLIDQRRESRSIVYSANYEALSGLVTFLMHDCCAGHLRVLGVGEGEGACCSTETSEENQNA
ncbi:MULTISPECIES: metalloregulator ArsR/SmtB family transcription factor [unclassified Rhizobium]|uniref:ArsR/SmtB family transcription factor n=1 Tax=unclassified Rhizobium TaxID=2613769 RepID=UPI00160EA23B|nr:MULTISPECIES: metalloregulator ArsR/SmtB family transcription factor [unclassified Rhizobium]MBB3545127.1 DNA-binding transcriptional ArsR family regulator [Rhizobium sp. BK399]MCS3743885.1 DNA-binding transcriptional ArsR family regulator [Rhizobium sp. BK661]MCS4095980.1 DNA-binding transcriptional ArsR family regulator [Rhizobium sp. BK176]